MHARFLIPVFFLLILLTPASSAVGGEKDILVITSAHLAGGLEAWMKHRRSQGHQVQVCLFEQTADREAEQTRKQALLDTIRRGRPAHILIAGNVAHVPAFRYTSKKLHKKCESDLPYGLPDPATALPALQVGRIPAGDAAGLEAALAKIIRHEKRFSASEARNTIQLLAGPANFGKTIDLLIESIATRMLSRELAQHYNLRVIYASPTSPFFLPQEDITNRTRQAFEDGPLVVIYTGHGSNRGFARVRHRGVTHYFDTGNAAGIRSRALYPLFFSITCSTGDYERADKPGLCAHLMLEPEGPVATFGSSEVSQPLPNLLLTKAVLHQVANRRLRTIGDAVAAVRADFSTRHHALGRLVNEMVQGKVDEAAQKIHHQYLYNLFGDPATRLGFPAKDIQLSARVEGSKLILTGSSPSVRNGIALIRYDVDRCKILGRIEPHRKMEARAAGDIIRKNHLTASNKTLFKHEVPITGGSFRLELDLTAATPRLIAGVRHRTFYFRVYARNKRCDAVGSLKFRPHTRKPPSDR